MIAKLFKKMVGRNPDGAEAQQTTPRQQDSAKGQNKSPSEGRAPQGKQSGNNRRNSGQQQGARRQNASGRDGDSRRNQKPDGQPRGESAVRDDIQTQAQSQAKSIPAKPKTKPQPPAKPWDISEFPVAPVEGKTRFHDLGVELPIMQAIADLGFEYCSPIQAQSLPHALKGRDVVGKAQTGTGKTAAFLTAIIDDLLKNPIDDERYAGEARALVIAPTRELVIQIAEDAKALCKHTDIQIHTLVGGMDYAKQQRRLHDALVDILVATPGRLLDFCRNQDVYLDQLEVLVIDEADRMLDMGFIPQVRQIVRQTPKREERQTLFFSATFTDEVHRLVEQWTHNPITIEIEPESVATDTVTQHVYLASTEEKYTLLYNLIQDDSVDSLIVFANRRDECRDLHEKLGRHGISAGLLSGEIPQNKRVSTLNAFKDGSLKVLVATDVAGRGIHIDGISHVVNFTLPEEPEDYVHRIGRTGRAGKRGTSVSFACEDDAFRLEPIAGLLGHEIKCEQPPEALLAEYPPLPPAPRRERRPSGDGRRGDSRRSDGRSGGGNRSGGRRPSSR